MLARSTLWWSPSAVEGSFQLWGFRGLWRQRYQNLGGTPFASEVSAAVSDWNVTDANLLTGSTAAFKVTYKNNGASGYDGRSTWACDGHTGESWINIYYTNSYSMTKRKCVWVHEIGHVMGLNHSSTANAIMNSVSTSNFAASISCRLVADDSQGMNALY
jgi:predicted Zn-dependent protease